MSTAKFEKLIDLIINEDNDKAEQLFHEIVVEKSRDIYESLINEDMTSDLVDEVSAEEEGMDGMMEDEEYTDDEEMEGDYDVEGDDVEIDFDDEVELDDEDYEEDEEEELEDRVVDLEDKLDQLMAEFEQEFGEEEMDDGEEEMDAGEEEMDAGEEEMELDEGRRAKQEREGLKDLRKSKEERRYAANDFDKVDEAVEMKKVTVTHTDGADASAKKSIVDSNSGQKGMASKPVNFSGAESVPTSPKRPSNYGAKGETEVKGAASFKNKVGGDASIGSGKGESAPKPVKTQATGANERSAVPESRRNTKRKV